MRDQISFTSNKCKKVLIRCKELGLICLPGMGSLDVASSSNTSCNNNSKICEKYGISMQERAISKACTPRLKKNDR